MKTVPVDQFLPRISPLVADCPPFSVRRAVSDTVVQICKEALCLTTEVFLKTKEDEDTYDVPMPEGLDAEIVRHAFCDGWEMKAVTIDELVRHYSPIDQSSLRGMPMFYCFQKRNRIRVSPAPEKEYGIKLVVTASTRRDAKDVPDIFFHDYVDVVVDGALARIYKTAGQAYSNFQLAAEYEARYEKGLLQVKEDSVRDYSRTTGRVVPNRWVY